MSHATSDDPFSAFEPTRPAPVADSVAITGSGALIPGDWNPGATAAVEGNDGLLERHFGTLAAPDASGVFGSATAGPVLDAGWTAKATHVMDGLIDDGWAPPSMANAVIPAGATFAPVEPKVRSGGKNPSLPATRPTRGDVASSRLVDALRVGLRVDESVLPWKSLDEQHMLLLGTLLRESVHGLVELLQGKAMFKRALRAEAPAQPKLENNPLKSSATSAGALRLLLAGRLSGLLDPVTAMREAFDDLQIHQLAVLASLRTAVDQALERTPPGKDDNDELVATAFRQAYQSQMSTSLARSPSKSSKKTQ